MWTPEHYIFMCFLNIYFQILFPFAVILEDHRIQFIANVIHRGEVRPRLSLQANQSMPLWSLLCGQGCCCTGTGLVLFVIIKLHQIDKTTKTSYTIACFQLSVSRLGKVQIWVCLAGVHKRVLIQCNVA